MTISILATMSTRSNLARAIKRKEAALEKTVADTWTTLQNPNFFGGFPIEDPSGKLISVKIHAYGHLAKFFEEDDIQERMAACIRKNNLEYSGQTAENVGMIN